MVDVQKKRIGLLIPNLQSGGAEKVMCNISHILAQNNEVYLFIFDSDNISYDYSGQIVDLKCKAKNNIVLKVLIRLLRIIKLSWYKIKIKPEIVISFLHAANMVNVWSVGKAKTIISCRGYGDFLHDKRQYGKSMKKIDTLIVQTERMKKEFLKEFHADAEKVRVLKNPFDVEKIIEMSKMPINSDYEEFFRQHRTICTVGSFKRDKGMWHLIKAFHEVKNVINDAGLVIVGHGGPMENEILKMAAESSYSEDILLLGYQKNPFAFVAKADVFACSSIYEGFPNVLIEAMLCMTPVISTDCLTGPKEILSDNTDLQIGETIYEADYGILSPPLSEKIDFNTGDISENEKQFAAAIMKRLSDKEKAKTVALRAFEKAKKFDYNFFYQELSDIIN